MTKEYEVVDFSGKSVGRFTQEWLAKSYLTVVWDGYGKIIEHEVEDG